MESVSLIAYAKINLFLEVLQRLENGYHLLDSLMQSISLADRIKITKNSGKKITMECNDESLPVDDGNLVIRAAKLFFESTGIENSGIHIVLDKKIPVGAGLAGGSADAAAVLEGLNVLFDAKVELETLCSLGAKLGADVPFCIKRGTCHAKGIGEILEKVDKLPECIILVAIGDERICTKWAFEQIDTVENRKINKSDLILSSLKKGKIEDVCRHMYNAFQTVSPHREEIKSIMQEYCIEKPIMSGSGPSVFSIFTDEVKAKFTYDRLVGEGYRTFMCHPV